MARVSEHFFNRRCTILRAPITGLGGGRWQEGVPAPVATGVHYQRSVAGSRDLDLGRARGVEVTHVGCFPPDTDVRRGDVVQDDGDGLKCAVKNVESPTIEIYLRAPMREHEYRP